MADNFAVGEADAAGAGAPPIETMGPRYGIRETQAVSQGRGEHMPLTEPYLLPSVHYRNGNMERVNPSIIQTPLGGMVPGPNAIAPAIPSGSVGDKVFPTGEPGAFSTGVADSWPEGSPVPLRS